MLPRTPIQDGTSGFHAACGISDSNANEPAPCELCTDTTLWSHGTYACVVDQIAAVLLEFPYYAPCSIDTANGELFVKLRSLPRMRGVPIPDSCANCLRDRTFRFVRNTDTTTIATQPAHR
jgi:hypothetical protein